MHQSRHMQYHTNMRMQWRLLNSIKIIWCTKW